MTWPLPLVLLRFPSEGSKLSYNSIQKICPGPAAGGKVGDSSPGCATLCWMPWVSEKPQPFSSCHPGGQVSKDPQPVTLTKAVRDRLSLIHQITSPKAVSAPWRRLQLLPFRLLWSFPPCLVFECLYLGRRSCLLSFAADPGRSDPWSGHGLLTPAPQLTTGWFSLTQHRAETR